jgi:hypothetical protein
MLGSDPIYQYDTGLRLEQGAGDTQPVVTLEPVYAGEGGGGGRRDWVDWFFDEVMRGCCLTFNYAQAGQENSFGWPGMKNGLLYQVERLAALTASGRVKVETLEESGAWFRERYPQTPNSAITALSDWKKEGRRSVWFCSKRFRVNFYAEKDVFWLRDLMLFDERYAERYLHDTCKGPLMTYDNLPVIDGNRWSGGGIRAGWYLCAGGEKLPVTDVCAEENGEDLLLTLQTKQGSLAVRCGTASISFESAIKDLSLAPKWNKSPEMEGAEFLPKELRLMHEGFEYSLHPEKGIFRDGKLFGENGSLLLNF